MNIHIRNYAPEDCLILARLFYDTVRRIASSWRGCFTIRSIRSTPGTIPRSSLRPGHRRRLIRSYGTLLF